MSTGQPNQPGISHALQPLLPGSSALIETGGDERSLVQLYMELTAESESQARSVLMFVCPEREEFDTCRQD